MKKTANASENHINSRMLVENLSQTQLIKKRFAKHRMAVGALFLLTVMYIVVLFGEFFAPYTPKWRDLDYAYCPPQIPKFSFSRGLYIHPMKRYTDPVTFKKTYVEDRENIVPLSLFARGHSYRMWNLIPMNRHFITIKIEKDRLMKGDFANVEISSRKTTFYLFGSDKYGRDILTRIIYGARVSLSV